MAVKSNLTNMAVVLSATCLVCSALLAGVYALTKETIDETEAKNRKAAIEAVLPEFSELETVECELDGKTYECNKALKDGVVVGYAVKTSQGGFGGDINLMVGITADGVIYDTKVLSHAETPGLGAKCTEEPFHGQWKGFNPAEKKLSVTKDGGSIDAITASTITSRAYVKAVATAVNVYNSLNGKAIDTVSGASTKHHSDAAEESVENDAASGASTHAEKECDSEKGEE